MWWAHEPPFSLSVSDVRYGRKPEGRILTELDEVYITDEDGIHVLDFRIVRQQVVFENYEEDF